MKKLVITLSSILLFAYACKKDSDTDAVAAASSVTPVQIDPANYPAIDAQFQGKIDLANLANYANQSRPNYILADNTAGNIITDQGATLGRVLFYDKELSIDRSLSCGSCHVQSHAFSDSSLQSVGVNGGMTARHSMRLNNARFGQEVNFFWDERASSLEEQTTMPIQDHAEMGFSGQNGNPDLDDLINRLQAIDYYREFFALVYGDEVVNEIRIQNALAQFIRSIESFDAKFDVGLAQTLNLNSPFPNYTAEENLGKNLFIAPPQQGGAGCQGCHQAPEFDIDPQTRNNGITGKIGGGQDLLITRSPSLRDVVNSSGRLNGPLMHDGSKTSLLQVIDHYNLIVLDPTNNNLDPRLMSPPGGPPQGQNLQLTVAEKSALVAFLETLSGSNVYTDEKWSSPF